MCVKLTEDTKAAWQSRKMGLAGLAPTGEAMNRAKETNRVVLGPMPRGAGADGGIEKEEMADMDEEEGMWVAGNVTMTKTESEFATMSASESATETEAGARSTKDYCDPTHLCLVIRLDYCGAGIRSRMQGECSVHSRATYRGRKYWDQPFRIRNKKKLKSLDGDTEGERSSG
jgi:hypothetical protein